MPSKRPALLNCAEFKSKKMKKKISQEESNTNANNMTGAGCGEKTGRIMTKLAPSVSSNKVSAQWNFRPKAMLIHYI